MKYEAMTKEELKTFFHDNSISSTQECEIMDILINRADPIIDYIEKSKQRFQRVIEKRYLPKILYAIETIEELKLHVGNETLLDYNDLREKLVATYSELISIGERQYNQVDGQVFLTDNKKKKEYSGIIKSKSLDSDYEKFIFRFDNKVKIKDAHILAYFMISDVLEEAKHKSPKDTANEIIKAYYGKSLKSKKTDYYSIALESESHKAYRHLEIPNRYKNITPTATITIFLGDNTSNYIPFK